MLRSRLDMTQPIFRELVGEFVEFAKQQVDEMRLALKNRDFEELAQLAHGLKGAGGTAGFDEFTQPSGELERSANENDKAGMEAQLEIVATLANSIVLSKDDSAATSTAL